MPSDPQDPQPVSPERRPRVWREPGVDGPLVTLKPCWVADFNGETAVFPTEDEARAFCLKRWRVAARV